jgi:outer membrane protein assembly factor BamB
VARESGPWIVGIDAATGRQRWRTRCAAGETACDVVGRRAGGRVVFLGTIEYRAAWSIGLFALDAASGRELWRARTSLEDRMAVHLAADEYIACALGHDRVIALDLAGGQVLWERRIDAGLLADQTRAIAAGGGVVAFADGGVVRVVEPRRGDDLATLRWGHSVGEIAIDDGFVYVVTDEADPSSRLIAAHLTAGRPAWELRRARLVPPLAIAEHHVYLRAAPEGGGATDVIAIDRSAGVEVARLPLGAVRRIAALDDLVIAESIDAEIVALTPAPRSAPQAITIRGTIVLRDLPAVSFDGARVRVGDAIVTSDAQGRFSATIPAVGVASIVVLDRPAGIPWRERCVFSRVTYLRTWEWSPGREVEVIVEPTNPCPRD